MDVIRHSDLFLALADELFQRKLWDQALNCYAAVQECDEISDDPETIYHIGVCHHQTKDLSQAVDALRWGSSTFIPCPPRGVKADGVVAKNDPGNLEARLRLATVLEEQGNKAEALEIVSEGASAPLLRHANIAPKLIGSPSRSSERSLGARSSFQSFRSGHV